MPTLTLTPTPGLARTLNPQPPPLFLPPPTHPSLASPQRGQHQIFVKTYFGQTLALLVKASDTVATVKAEIRAKARIAPDEQRLVFAGRQLQDGRTLGEYRVRQRSVLELVPRVRGGMRLVIPLTDGESMAVDVKASDTELNLLGSFVCICVCMSYLHQ